MADGPQSGPTRNQRRYRHFRPRYVVPASIAGAAALVAVSTVSLASTRSAGTADSAATPATAPASAYRIVPRTDTPIKHVVVLFDENVSFDHYFGTYPNAANTDGSPFHAKKDTPKVNGLTTKLLTANPNSYNPTRLTSSQALTCDQNHGYSAEQKAFDGGAMDKFVQFTETDVCTGQPILFGQPGLVMDYYDGNTVTGLWNYAQNYALNDNSYNTNFGPSTPGALNVISGSDGAAYAVSPSTGATVSSSAVSALNSKGLGTIYGDLDPAYDDCSDGSHVSSNPVGIATGQNIGDLLNARHVTWGWFQGGFTPTATNAAGFAVCGSSHQNIGGNASADYSPHHNPFAYYTSTANPKHLPPTSVAAIGRTDQANHQYDLSYFSKALDAGSLPAVSYVKAAEYQDGHPGYSDPADEQHFIVSTVNQIEQSKYWDSTAIVITYDDSDGWYDHQASPIINGSNDPATDTALCTSAPVGLGGYPDRCGFGPRVPLLVISPYARSNYVSHQLTDQSSVVTFIEDNWLRGKRIGSGSLDAAAGSLDSMFNFRDRDARPLILDPATGEKVG